MKKITVFSVIAAAATIAVGGSYIYYTNTKIDTPPVITTEGNEVIECTVDASTKELAAGLVATDQEDGDLTDRILVNDIRIKDGEDAAHNEFDITYVVFDSANNMSFASRTLVYTDYVSPHFGITERLTFPSVSGVDLYGCITAEDCIDGDISSQVNIEHEEAFLNAVSTGEYSSMLSVTNSVGDTAKLPITFQVNDETDTTRPIFRLTDYLVYLKQGEKFSARKYLEKMKIGNTIYLLKASSEVDMNQCQPYNCGYRNYNGEVFILKDSVKVDSDVDVNTPGTYNVEYSFKNPEEGTRGYVKMMVVVE